MASVVSRGAKTESQSSTMNADTTFRRARAARRLLTTLFPFVPGVTVAWGIGIQLMNGLQNLDREYQGLDVTLLAR